MAAPAFRITAHRHECETSWLAYFSIGYDLNLCDAPKLFEDTLKLSFSDAEHRFSCTMSMVWRQLQPDVASLDG